MEQNILWNGQPLTFRKESSSDPLKAYNEENDGLKEWYSNNVYYSNLPSFLSSKFPMLGSSIVNSGNENSVYLPSKTLVYMLRNEGWSGVDVSGWTDTGEKGRFLNDENYPNVVIFYRIMEPGFYVFDSLSAMYLFTDPLNKP